MGWYYGDGLESEPNTNAGTGADTESDTESALWGVNYPFYINLVGKWPDRVDNMYFTFLVMLRAVSKIQFMFPTSADTGSNSNNYNSYNNDYNPTDQVLNIDTGNIEEDQHVYKLLKLLTSSTNIYPNANHHNTNDTHNKTQCDVITNQIEAEQCRIGFDETALFTVPEHTGPAYFAELAEKDQLLRDVRARYV